MFINIYYFAHVKVSLPRLLFQINAEFFCTTLNVLEGEICFLLFLCPQAIWELVLDRALAEAVR